MRPRTDPQVFVLEDLREHLRDSGIDEQALVRSFLNWKALQAQGKEHFAFGRDVPGRDNPHLRHVHMVPLKTPKAYEAWNLEWRRAKGRETDRTSNRYLLYADGTPAHGYLLITLINDPLGHSIWNKENKDIVELMERIADDFHHFGKLPVEDSPA